MALLSCTSVWRLGQCSGIRPLFRPLITCRFSSATRRACSEAAACARICSRQYPASHVHVAHPIPLPYCVAAAPSDTDGSDFGENEDLLAPRPPSSVARPPRGSLRHPWKQPRFVQRSQEAPTPLGTVHDNRSAASTTAALGNGGGAGRAGASAPRRSARLTPQVAPPHVRAPALIAELAIPVSARAPSSDDTSAAVTVRAGPSGDDSDAASSGGDDGATARPPPRVRSPELYAGLALPRSAKARALARGDAGVAGFSRSVIEGEGAFEAVLDEVEGLAGEGAGSGEGGGVTPQGIMVDYCVFCYHGTHFLDATNGALLTKFVSDRGSLLPKRFTKCCAKHQRKLSRTIKRARWLNLIPHHSKLHPKLRFSSLSPSPIVVAAPPSAGSSMNTPAGSSADARDGGLRLAALAGQDRGALLSAAQQEQVDIALGEISRLAAGGR